MLVSQCISMLSCLTKSHSVVTNIYWLPWCLPHSLGEHKPYQILFCFHGKLFCDREFRVSDGVSPPALCRPTPPTCSTKPWQDHWGPDQSAADYWLAGSGLNYRPATPPAWVLHRMSSDLIIMDIWSSLTLTQSQTANHKTIPTLPQQITISSPQPGHYQLLLRIWKLGQSGPWFASQQEEKQNKASQTKSSWRRSYQPFNHRKWKLR